jgi:thiol:disulfide interchange protein DsbC
MKRLLLVLCGAVSLSACAQTPPSMATTAPATSASASKAVLPASVTSATTPEAKARAAILAINPGIQIDQVEPAPLPGFQLVIMGGQLVYVSNDGKYLMQGALYDVASRTDLGEKRIATVRAKLLQAAPVSERIVFAPPHPKYTVAVFTDVECAYCRKFHSQIADYNRQGIAVEYLAFPRAGIGSDDYKKMVAVWCAADPKQALTDAKNDRPVVARNCKNPVTTQYNLGQRVGLTGTPMVVASDGTLLGGYVPPDKLRAQLDKLASGGQPATGGPTGQR